MSGIRPDITLNLGTHWEYFGQPYERRGLAARVVGDESAFTKVTCTSDPGNPNFVSTCSNLVQTQFVGKNSTNPGVLSNIKGNDLNNFAPSVGFSWGLPWFGKGKTVIRSGYGISYEGSLRNFITVDGTISTVPGINLISSGGTGVNYVPHLHQPVERHLADSFPVGTPDRSPSSSRPRIGH
jgi:hypothetical protein